MAVLVKETFTRVESDRQEIAAPPRRANANYAGLKTKLNFQLPIKDGENFGLERRVLGSI